MDSIGKLRKKRLLSLIKHELNTRTQWDMMTGNDYKSIKEMITYKVPVRWFNVWPGAYREIDKLISDALTNYFYEEEVKF